MPPRRASTAAAHIITTTTTRHVHRSNESNHSISKDSGSQNLPYGQSALPNTPQQKVVYVLVNRLKNKLPCNSGITLTELEADEAIQQVVESLVELSRDSLDIIAMSLSELLEKLGKQIDMEAYRNLDVLQSQLFVLKVLSIAMASRWTRRPDSAKSESYSGKAPSVAPSKARSNGGTSLDQLSATLIEPPPLDDNCAKYVLSVMVLFLRHTAPPTHRLMSSASMNFVASYHDFESIDLPEADGSADVFGDVPNIPPTVTPFPRVMSRARHSSSTTLNSAPSTTSSGYLSKHAIVYEATSLLTSRAVGSLNSLIAKFVGRVIYHLSASNWTIVFSRIQSKIRYLASTTEDDPDIIDLQLMTHSALDRVRLTQTLHELSSLLVNMKREAQAAVAIPLRSAIWNWIDLFPEEYNDAVLRHRRLEGGAAERVCDILSEQYDLKDKLNENIAPTLTALTCISPERILRNEYGVNSIGVPLSTATRKDKSFADAMIRNLMFETKLSEVSLICSLDICRAAFRLNPADGGENALVSMAQDIAHQLKGKLLTWGSTRPFWEYSEELDVALVGDILVTIYRYLPPEDTMSIFTTCVEPETSLAAKLAAMKACTTLVMEAGKCPWQRSLEPLKAVIIPRLCVIYKVTATRRLETDANGVVKKISPRPKPKRYTSETLPDRDLVVFAILSQYRLDPMWFLEALEMSQEPKWVTEALDYWRTPRDLTHKLCMARTFRSLVDCVVKMTPEHPRFEVSSAWLRESAPAVLASVAMNLIDARTDLQSQRMFISMAYEIMHRFSGKTKEHMEPIQLSSERVPAFGIAEIAFLVSLTSADSHVTLTAAHCLRLLARAQSMPNAPDLGGVGDEDRTKRHPLYEQLGDPSVVAIGRVGHQKRIRKIIRSMTFASATNIAVWEECFWRWNALGDIARRISNELDGLPPGTTAVGDHSMSVDECQAQWQNLMLFLTAFGSACIRDEHDPAALTKTIPSYYLPDQMRILRDPADLLSSFIGELVNLLVADSVQAREFAREALSTELHPRLYTRIFKELDNVIRQLDEEGNVAWDYLMVFLDQFVSILKVLVENVQNVEEMRGIDIGSTLHILAGFIGRSHERDTAISRLKIKYCVLCDAVFKRAETIIIRKDGETRQRIVDIVIDWTEDPSSESREQASQQRELNMTALQTMVKLLDHLQLHAPEGASREEASHVISRSFMRYHTFLLKVMESNKGYFLLVDEVSDRSSAFSHLRVTQQEEQLRDLVMTGMTSLISANIESGLKHCMPLAYDNDVNKQILFANVFRRVLGEGIQFSAEETQPIVNRQSRLCELIKGPDMVLALAICEVCPPNEVDGLITVLLNLFDSRSSLMTLLKMMIDLEVARTESDTALFRSNSTCTRFLSAFANTYGYNYLRSIIDPLLKTMSSLPPGHGYELDPTKVGAEAARQNSENVKLVVGSFLQILTSSVPAIPSMFREICAHIAKVVQEVWPEAKFAAIGSFMFLRFISPAIVSPDSIDIDWPRDDPIIRRGLMVIAKVMQSLANNIFFGKEAYMTSLNKFLEANIMNVTRFLSEVKTYTPSPGDDDSDEYLNTSYDETDTIVLHRFLEKHADKVGKELLSLSKPSPDKQSAPDSDTSAGGKRLWEALCAALLELGQPLESPRLSILTSSEHREYKDLMSRYKHKDTTTVQDIFVEALFTPAETPAVFVLSVSKIDVEVFDMELLLYYVFKTLTTGSMAERKFDIAFDFTSFTPASQIPAQWLKFAHEVIPSDIRKRFGVAHILSPNALALRYLRKLYNLASGIPLSERYVAHPSVQELLQFYPPGIRMASLDYAVALEREPADVWKDATLKHSQPMRVPVTLAVAVNHLRITTVKAVQICSSLSCRATEILPLSEVNDVYNVSTGHEAHEFLVRKVRHGVTLYFSSPARDDIVKTIRTAKGHTQAVQLPGAERFTRLSNIVVTLLHIGMTSMSSEDEELHNASHGLLVAVCAYLDYDGKPLMPSPIVSGPSGVFLVQLNEGLASFAPQLTLDFVCESIGGMRKATTAQRVNCLHYITPWIKNMQLFTDPTYKYYEPSGTKFKDCIRILLDLTLAEQELSYLVQKHIWVECGKMDSPTINLILDDLFRAAIDGGLASHRVDAVAKILSMFPGMHVRTRLSTRMRKVIGKTSTKPTKSLVDNAHWTELVCLCRLALVTSYQNRSVTSWHVFLPDTLYVAGILAATGPTYVRASVYGVLLNMLNAMYTARSNTTTSSPEAPLHALIKEFEQPETLRLFGLVRHTASSVMYTLDAPSDKILVDNMESLMRFLLRILETISDAKGAMNVWRARWMSLITSSAFQMSPAVQTRSFIALGVLATSDVDDDLLYQMLVAFKTALVNSSETDISCVVSMLRCIRNVTPALPRHSRYICQLFWLAVSLLQSSHIGLYVEAIHLLRVSLETMDEQGSFDDSGVSTVLLEGRAPLEEIAGQLDQLLGLSFEASFTFALASIMFKGVRQSALRDAAEAALRSLVRITTRKCREAEHAEDGPGTPICQEVLGYFLALLPMSTTSSSFRQLVDDANLDVSWVPEASSRAVAEQAEALGAIPFKLFGVVDTTSALFVVSFVSAMLASAQGDDAESQILYCLLSDVSDAFPDIAALTYESLRDRLTDAFATSSSPAIISAVSNIFRVAMQDAQPTTGGPGSETTLNTMEEGGPSRKHLYALEELNMQGLANNFQFLPPNKGHATTMLKWISELVVKIIE